MEPRKLTILVLDDDRDVTDLLADLLGEWFSVRTAHSTTEGVARMREQLPDVLLSDYHLPGETSEALLRVVARRFPTLRRILMSGSPAHEWGHLVRSGVVEAALAKPFRAEQLLAILDGAQPEAATA